MAKILQNWLRFHGVFIKKVNLKYLETDLVYGLRQQQLTVRSIDLNSTIFWRFPVLFRNTVSGNLKPCIRLWVFQQHHERAAVFYKIKILTKWVGFD